MANEFYQKGPERASRVRQLFDTIAPKYDLVNDIQSFGLHRLWKSRMFNLCQLAPDHLALDICTGTGDVAFLLSDSGARVVGLDFSVPMLQSALEKSQKNRKHTSKPSFMASDALHLPFPKDCFHAVTISYGLRNLADFQGGIAEMLRVTKPGGCVLVLDFGKPDLPLWRAIYFTYLRCLVPFFGWLFHGNAAAYAYILESLNHYPAQHGVQKGMQQAGYINTRIHSILGGVMTINYGQKPL